jgi:hypothetical protein
VDKLKAMGEYDDTLLVVVADHGIAFGERVALRGLSRQNFPQIAWVPMLVKAPEQREARVDDRRARTIDLVPTIADHLGVRMPWDVDGRSLLGEPVPDGPLKLLEWDRDVMKADKDGFTTIPGPDGFALVKAWRANDAPGDGVRRLYAVGPYGALLGRRVDGLDQGTPRGAVTLDTPERYDDVRPGAREAPWYYSNGQVEGVRDATPLAVSVNGVVAGLSGAYANPLIPDDVRYWTVLDPKPFRRGRNDVRVWVITGDPGAPRLVPLRRSDG